MAWWLRCILVGLISLFSLGLVPSSTMAAPAQTAPAQTAPVVESNPIVQPDADGATLDGATSYPIIPQLTNPAEIPIAEDPTIEIEPSLTTSLAWLHKAIEGKQSPKTDTDSQGNGNATLKQWLSSINSVLEGQ